ncbi:Gfo/Idh/MocA family oxidoreductase, partial [Erwinia amylovora]|uniref:Gfo/Idh/MocA family oxidoreductase n=1 Tax=Erwinia amylovora TaxID=552 RepID=UPI0020BEF5A2
KQVEKTLLTLPGNYPAYYAGIRDAVKGTGENPVKVAEAIQVMEIIELGLLSAEKRQSVSLK